MKKILHLAFLMGIATHLLAQNPTPFGCNSADSVGYYISSSSSTQNSNVLTYSSSRLSKIETPTGNRTTVCTSTQIGVALNAMGFNPMDNYMYAVSRFDATQFSGKLYRIGENCQKLVIPVTGAIAAFSNNNMVTVDAAGGTISSGTFDLNNNYYVNTSFARTTSTGFTNKIQKIKITGNTAAVVSSKTLTCPSCTTTTKIQITDIIFDEATDALYGSNKQTNQLYRINTSTGVITPIGSTGITSTILGMYKNVYGDIRAIDEAGKIYNVNVLTGVFTDLNSQATLNSGNADAASGCYDPPFISGNLFVDANGLTDNIVNGIGVAILDGSTALFANLIQGGLVVRSSAIKLDGSYTFLGLFTGTYEVQISTELGIKDTPPPAQNLPSTHVFTGENIGTGTGNDGSPNGKISVTIPVAGGNVTQVNFGIDAIPVANDINNGSQLNPGGTVQVNVPNLDISDAEDGTPSTIIILQIPNPATQGVLYYNGLAITSNQTILNFDDNLLRFDPIDGEVIGVFTYAAIDAANVQGNTATGTLEFTTSLPIELVDFKGVYKERKVLLSWLTASELNSSHFVVQRSAEGIDFEDLEEIPAAENSKQMLEYATIDESPSIYFYYRLKAVDLDETFDYSNTIYVGHPKEIDVAVFPTVVVDELFVRYKKEQGDDQQLMVAIYTMDGKQLSIAPLQNDEQTINFSNKTAGAYSVVISSKDGKRLFAKKIIKQ